MKKTPIAVFNIILQKQFSQCRKGHIELATFGTEGPSLKSISSKRMTLLSFKYVFRMKYFLILANLFSLRTVKTVQLFFYKQSKIKLRLKAEC